MPAKKKNAAKSKNKPRSSPENKKDQKSIEEPIKPARSSRSVIDRSTKEVLPVELTAGEIHLYAKESARLHGDLIKLDQQRKDAAASFRAQMAGIETRIGELNRKIESGHEDREVPCFWRFDYVAGTKTLFRRADPRRPGDEDEEIRSYPLLPDERQQRLPLGEPRENRPDAATSASPTTTITVGVGGQVEKAAATLTQKTTTETKEDNHVDGDGKHDATPTAPPQ